jgi:DNA-binding NarL/FixJ family response regulator
VSVDSADGLRATDELTAREVEVCLLVAEGLSNNDIAQRLFLSPRTVQSHVANAMMKTNAASRTQLAVMMIRDGLVPAVHPGQEVEGLGLSSSSA